VPKYSYKRDDVIRQEELDETFDAASRVNAYDLPGTAWQCLIAIMWLYGKRISECVSLTNGAVRVTKTGKREYLSVAFNVLKKRSYKDPGIKRPFVKRVIRENPYTDYILNWHTKAKDGHRFLFYRQQTKMGYIYRQYANQILNKISPRISPHLFRHSLATQMAEEGATAYQILNWFDWDRTDTALEYIKRGGRMTQELSDRKW